MKALTLPGGVPTLSADLRIPRPGSGEVLVRVSHSSVNSHEFELAQAASVRILRWLAGYRGRVRTGLEFSGTVRSEGDTLLPGDRVMGYIDMTKGNNTHAEWIVIPESQVAKIPDGISFQKAATLPMSAQTALVALRDVAQIERDQRILVFGASGGVGLALVQLARHLGARVTAVARDKHHEILSGFGAEHLIDYRSQPLEKMEGHFDAIFEFSDTLSLADVVHLLAPRGLFVPADPIAHLVSILTRGAARWLLVDKGKRPLLEEIVGYVEQGILEPRVGLEFPLSEWQAAIQESQERKQTGRVVLCFDEVKHS